MQLQLCDKVFTPFHVPTDIGRQLITLGVAKIFGDVTLPVGQFIPYPKPLGCELDHTPYVWSCMIDNSRLCASDIKTLLSSGSAVRVLGGIQLSKAVTMKPCAADRLVRGERSRITAQKARKLLG